MEDSNTAGISTTQSRIEKLHLRARLDHFHWKSVAKAIVGRLGYSISRTDPVDRSDGEREDPFFDQKRILAFAGQSNRATVFDVGANVGQSVLK
jgi:hypothetical protein